MKVLLLNFGGEIETTFLGRARPASCAVDVYTPKPTDDDPPKPTQKVTAAVGTVDAVNTTLSAAAQEGDDHVQVTSAAGIVAGRRYAIGAEGTGEPPETISVRAVDGTTVILWGRLSGRHASGVAFAGVRVSYVVLAAACDETWAGGHAVFTPDAGTPQTEAVDCARTVIPDALCDMTDVRRELPSIDEMMDRDLDVRTRLREARDAFLLDLGPERVRATLGVQEFRRPAALKFLLLLRHMFGERKADLMKGISADYKDAVEGLRRNLPTDRDQDGIPNEEDCDGTSDLLGWEAV